MTDTEAAYQQGVIDGKRFAISTQAVLTDTALLDEYWRGFVEAVERHEEQEHSRCE